MRLRRIGRGSGVAALLESPAFSGTDVGAGSHLRLPPEPLPPRAAGRTLITGQQLDDLLAHAAEVGAELDEDLGGDAFALADEPEEDVLGADVVVAELQRFAQRQLEHLLGTRG